MKTAKELFEELGYGLNTNRVFKDWVIYGELFKGHIIFDLSFEHVICNITITPKLHKAIHQEMKELGWLDAE